MTVVVHVYSQQWRWAGLCTFTESLYMHRASIRKPIKPDPGYFPSSQSYMIRHDMYPYSLASATSSLWLLVVYNAVRRGRSKMWSHVGSQADWGWTRADCNYICNSMQS